MFELYVDFIRNTQEMARMEKDIPHPHLHLRGVELLTPWVEGASLK